MVTRKWGKMATKLSEDYGCLIKNTHLRKSLTFKEHLFDCSILKKIVSDSYHIESMVLPKDEVCTL